MEQIRLKLQVVTPLFLDGADGRSAELRAPSIRGVLRFWTRAVVGGRCGDNLPEIKKAETAIFGAAETASPLVVQVRDAPIVTKIDDLAYGDAKLDADREKSIAGDAYLGYGPLAFKQGLFRNVRECIAAGSTFSVTFKWRRPATPQAKADLLAALWCWLHLGGLGARSRRGFGSLACLDADGDAAATDLQELFPFPGFAAAKDGLEAKLKDLRRDPATPLPEFSRFSPASSITLVRGHDGGAPRSFKNADEALRSVGNLFIIFRRRYGSPNDAAHPNHDYVWAYRPGNGPDIPDRVGFGLPLLFGKGKAQLEGNSQSRRASPLFVHVEPCGSGYLTALTHLPAKLLPDGDEIFDRAGRIKTRCAPTAAQIGIVGEFTDWAAKPSTPAQWNTSTLKSRIDDFLKTICGVKIV